MAPEQTQSSFSHRIDLLLGRVIALLSLAFWGPFGLMFLYCAFFDDRLPIWSAVLGIFGLWLARTAWYERRSFSEMGKNALIVG